MAKKAIHPAGTGEPAMWQGQVGSKGHSGDTQGYGLCGGGRVCATWPGGMMVAVHMVTSIADVFCGLTMCQALSGALSISFILPDVLLLCLHLADKKDEVQRGTATYPKPHSKYVAGRNVRP